MDLKKEKMVSILLVAASLLVIAPSDQPAQENSKKVIVKQDIVSSKQAAPAKATIIKKVETKKKTLREKISGEFSITTNTNTEDFGSEDKTYSSDFRLISGYQVNENFRVSTWIEFEKDLSRDYKEKLKDSKIMFGLKKYTFFDDKLIFAPGVNTVIPTSKASKVKDEMYGAIELNPTLVAKLTNSLTFTYLPRVKRSFHKYKTNRTNRTNTQYSLIQFFVLNYAISDKWYVEPALIYVSSTSYSGRRKDDQYLMVLETGYSVKKDIALIMGTETSGAIFDREFGPDETIEVFDKDKSSIYGKVSFTF